jgi:hypothetical protein
MLGYCVVRKGHPGPCEGVADLPLDDLAVRQRESFINPHDDEGLHQRSPTTDQSDGPTSPISLMPSDVFDPDIGINGHQTSDENAL